MIITVPADVLVTLEWGVLDVPCQCMDKVLIEAYHKEHPKPNLYIDTNRGYYYDPLKGYVKSWKSKNCNDRDADVDDDQSPGTPVEESLWILNPEPEEYKLKISFESHLNKVNSFHIFCQLKCKLLCTL